MISHQNMFMMFYSNSDCPHYGVAECGGHAILHEDKIHVWLLCGQTECWKPMFNCHVLSTITKYWLSNYSPRVGFRMITEGINISFSRGRRHLPSLCNVTLIPKPHYTLNRGHGGYGWLQLLIDIQIATKGNHNEFVGVAPSDHRNHQHTKHLPRDIETLHAEKGSKFPILASKLQVLQHLTLLPLADLGVKDSQTLFHPSFRCSLVLWVAYPSLLPQSDGHPDHLSAGEGEEMRRTYLFPWTTYLDNYWDKRMKHATVTQYKYGTLTPCSEFIVANHFE